jgi:hypothetical protein
MQIVRMNSEFVIAEGWAPPPHSHPSSNPLKLASPLSLRSAPPSDPTRDPDELTSTLFEPPTPVPRPPAYSKSAHQEALLARSPRSPPFGPHRRGGRPHRAARLAHPGGGTLETVCLSRYVPLSLAPPLSLLRSTTPALPHPRAVELLPPEQCEKPHLEPKPSLTLCIPIECASRYTRQEHLDRHITGTCPHSRVTGRRKH